MEQPRLMSLKKGSSLNRREVNLDRDLRNNTKKFKQIVKKFIKLKFVIKV